MRESCSRAAGSRSEGIGVDLLGGALDLLGLGADLGGDVVGDLREEREDAVREVRKSGGDGGGVLHENLDGLLAVDDIAGSGADARGVFLETAKGLGVLEPHAAERHFGVQVADGLGQLGALAKVGGGLFHFPDLVFQSQVLIRPLAWN